ncbi:MAG: SpoIIE family protein phosphatase [bacterium]
MTGKKKKPKKERLKLGVRSMAFRYSIFFSLSIFIIFFIYFIITLVYSVQLVAEDTRKNTENLTELTLSRLTNALSRVEQMPLVLGKSLDEPSPDYYEILRILQGIVLDDPYIFGTCLAFEPYAYQRDSLYYAIYSYETPKGLRTKYLGGRSYNYFTKDWYRIPKEQNKPGWSEPYYDLGAGDTLMCTYSVPFYKNFKGEQRLMGVLTLDVSLSSLGKIVSKIKVYESGFGVLISKGGIIIYAPDSTLINKNILEIAKERKNKALEEIVQKMMNGESGYESFSGLDKKKSSEVYYSPLASTGWSVGVIFPTEEVYASLLDLVKYLLAAFGIILVVVLLVSILITNRLTSPIKKLVRLTHQIGHGDFSVEIPRVKRRDEIGVLANSFSVMLEHLRNYIQDLEKTTAEKKQIESELNIAHTIQMGMLPREFPLRSECELFAVLDSARAVGGDLYDFFFLDQDHMFISVGDVSGKGVPASLFMTVVRTLFRSRTMDGQPLHQIMSLINQELCKDNPNVMFVTMVSGIINLKTGFIELCNAGHNPPLLMHKDGKVKRINLFPAIPLGIMEYHQYKTEKIQMEPGDRLVLYTDGVTEALNLQDDFFTEKRLLKVLHEHSAADVPALVKGVVDSIHTFAEGVEQADDITLLILGFQKTGVQTHLPMETRHLSVRNQLEELPLIVACVEEITRLWNISSKTSMEINLVLEELFANIVFYAFPDKKEHRIDMAFELLSPGLLQIRIEDDGRYFDLIEASEEVKTDVSLEERKIGGLGIHFVKQMMDGMKYIRKGGKNCVILIKHF